MVTINDVAKKAGVSKSSVSRVLNGNYEYMSEDLKNRIISVMNELNYSPNLLAQSLKKKKTGVIGIILSDISNPFWSEVLKGVQMECSKNGYGLMVNNSDEDSDEEKENVTLLRSKQVDGMIINTSGKNTDMYQGLLEDGYPFVLLDRLLNNLKADTVVVDNVLGANRAVSYLIEQGHERIAILSYPPENKSPREDRLYGYRQTLVDHGIPIDEDLIKICEQEQGKGVEATVELLSMANKPTAIFSTHAMLNLEILTGVEECKLQVPNDVSVLGYDDFAWVPLLNPPLTTVGQPAFELGAKAAKLLIERIEKQRDDEGIVIQLDPQLIVRKSCSVPSLKTI